MSYRIVASDLDETLIPPNRVIGRRAIDAIRRSVDAGVKFMLCTGRGYATVQGTLAELGLVGLPDEYVISYNGAMLSENDGNRVLSFEGLPFETADALYRRGVSLGLCVHAYTQNQVWVHGITPGEVEFLDRRQEWIDLPDATLERLRDQRIAKVLFLKEDDDAYLHEVEKKVSDLTADVTVSYSSNRYIEFNRKGINKGYGLTRLAGLLGVDMANVIAIGDNDNDLTMIEAAGLGCGVANVRDEVRPSCDYVCQANWDEGVAEVLERFVLA